MIQERKIQNITYTSKEKRRDGVEVRATATDEYNSTKLGLWVSASIMGCGWVVGVGYKRRNET